MKALLLVLSVVLMTACASSNHVSAGGGDSGVSGKVSTSVRF